MQFYKIVVDAESKENESKFRKHRVQRDGSQNISEQCKKYNGKLGDRGFLFLSSAGNSSINFGAILREKVDVNKFINKFLPAAIPQYEKVTIGETTFSIFRDMLGEADRNGYVFNDEEILRDFNLYELDDGRRVGRIDFEENILTECEQSVIRSSAERFFTRDSFVPELDRIFASEKQKHFVGHPVDYLIETDDVYTQNGVTKLLLQALLNVGRLENKRYTELLIAPGYRYGNKRVLNTLYKSCVGGAVVIKLEMVNSEDQDMTFRDLESLEEICGIARRRRDVLSVFCLPRKCDDIRQRIFENMNGCSFVEIKDEQMYMEKAKEYLKQKAFDNKIRPDKRLYSQLEADYRYLTLELNQIFDEWYSTKLKTGIYKQYKDIACVDVKVAEEKSRGVAYDELKEMIGLESAKRVIDQTLDRYKALKLFKDKGIVADEMSMHMIFTGNPGSAKTTVARLFTRILKDNGIIESGHIVEVGRGDLVGKYVGWTASNIQREFKKARGGVLFIDEAYSLVDARDGMYGDEAINTIVQEMENHRGDVIVIFAGYPDKMEGFLQKNPGLRSRIAHHVHFEDYNPDELCNIAKLIAKRKGVKLDDVALEKLHDIMEQAILQDDFGNGRYVRNIIEKAKMAQLSRLVHMSVENVTKEDVKLILAEDIEMPVIGAEKKIRKIGFVE